jgi:glycosyltransferase involved in cell wall biosynthesis
VKCSLVVPVFNEGLIIESFCEELEAIKKDFDEVIFVDGGSTDDSVKVLNSFKKSLNAKIIELGRSLPGKGRNYGVKAASHDIVVFIDVGVSPERNWLAHLKKSYSESDLPFCWGCCHFEGVSFVSNILAALSTGHGRTVGYVIPASLFHKSIFDEVGFFDPLLRAGEDVLFRRGIFDKYGSVGLCRDAVVFYRTFPLTFHGCFRKWFVYASFCSKGNISIKEELAYYLFFGGLVLLSILNLGSCLSFLGVYFFLRGVIDPIRRSRSLKWWFPSPVEFLIAPFFAICLDLSKCLGFLKGRLFGVGT